jgi:hypothetical protein
VTFEFGRGLLVSGTVSPDELARALVVTLEPGMPLARALVGLGLVNEDDLQRQLARSDPSPPLGEVRPRLDLLGMLPPGLCNRLAALPVSVDTDGTVAVAVLDPRDSHIAAELGYHLQRPVRLVRAPYPLVREALVNCATSTPSSIPPPGGTPERRRPISYTPAWGTPSDAAAVSESSRPHAQASPAPQPAAVGASVTTSTRRFFAGMHSAPSEHPAAIQRRGSSPPLVARGVDSGFELRRGPNMTLPDLEPPTTRPREAPAYPLVAALPNAPPAIAASQALAAHFPDPASTLGLLRAALDRDEVLGLVERSARSVAQRVAIFVVRKDALVGWSCSAEFGAVDALRGLSISLRAPSLLTSVLAGGVYLGPLLGSVGTAILRVMRTASRDVAIVAVRVADKPAVVIVCDDLGDTLLATRHLDIMAKVAGEALERVIRVRRG